VHFSVAVTRFLPFAAIPLLECACTAAPPAESAPAASSSTALYTLPRADDEAPPEARLSDLHGFHFVVDYGRPFVVLDDAAGLDVLGGSPVPLPLKPQEGVVAAWAPMVGGNDAPAPLPEVERGQVLYDSSGIACFGSIGEPVLLYRAEYDGTDAEPQRHFVEDVAASPPAALLVAPVDVKGGDCTGARWARPSLLPPPRFYAPEGEPTPLEEAGWATDLAHRARALPEFATIQQEFESRDAGAASSDDVARAPSTRWEENPDASRIAQRYVDPESGESLVTVDLASLGGCGEFNEALWTVARERNGKSGAILQSLSGIGPGAELLDVDDDGVVELFTDGALVISTDDGPRSFSVPDAYFVCPC
jgi:hypothetical protein